MTVIRDGHFLVLNRLGHVCKHALLITVFLLCLNQADGKSTQWARSNSGPECPKPEQRGGAANRGIIISQNYPLPYPAGMCYQWMISARLPGETITISFSDLDLHSGPEGKCLLDYIEIGPGPHTYKQCGSIPDVYPPPFISSKSNAWIRFVTAPASKIDGSRRGFSLTYIIGSIPAEKCEEDEFRCNNSKCILKNWKCNGGDECGDGSDESGCQVIVKPTPPPDDECGEGKFVCLSATTRELVCLMNIQKCNGKVECLSGEDERNCEVQKVCGGVLSGHAGGYFTSPNFPDNYPTSVNCEWLILVPENDVIQLRFGIFKLESGFDTDYIVVYDGQDEDSDEIGKYYGRHGPPAVVESSSYKMFVKFHSDGSIPQQGFNVTYQVKGVCLKHQKHCGYNEKECFESTQICDGKWDCPHHGGDERGCNNCKPDEFTCGDKEAQCYAEKDRCNGKGKCRNMADEKSCTPAMCGPLNGTFLCKNGRCIQETWQCDNQADCDDGSDEVNCPVTTRVVTAAVIGSLICGLLLVIALGCTCKLYALRMQDRYGGRYETPLTRIQNHIGRRRAPPPYNEAMVTSRPYDEVERERRQLLQSQQASDNTRENSSNSSNDPQGGNDVAPSSSVQRNSSQLSLTQTVDVVATGCVAQWRRIRPNKHVRRNVNTVQGQNVSSGHSSSVNPENASASASIDSVTVSVDSSCLKPEDEQSDPTNSAGVILINNVIESVDAPSLSLTESPEPGDWSENAIGQRGSVSSQGSVCSDTHLLLA